MVKNQIMEKLKILNSIISLSWLSLTLIITILISSFVLAPKTITLDEPKAFCGTCIAAANVPDSLSSNLFDGKQLFKAMCAKCHNKNMKDDLTGPALGGVTKRWKEYPAEDLYNYIRNPQQLVREKHPRAVEISNFSASSMTNFPNLSNDEIKSILLYIEM